MAFKAYKKTALTYMRPYIEGEQLPSKISISEADRKAGSPKLGDMIAHGANPDDQWLVAKTAFKATYEEA